MKVLSLFDGISCGQLALHRAGLPIDIYYASEVDKYAMQVTMANFPNTIQLGSVTDIDCTTLPKIDLLIGGSPCQSFSFAGRQKGMSTIDNQEVLTLDHYLELKAKNYEFDGESFLFWEYMRILTEIKPKYFLLENVVMEDKWVKVISKALDVHPIKICSSLVSAQNRKRLYWSNIGMQPSGLFGDLFSIIKEPTDKGIYLKDILESNVSLKYFISERMIESFQTHKERHDAKGTGFGFEPKTPTDKGNCLRTNSAICPTDNIIIDTDCKYGFHTCGNYQYDFCETCDDGDNYEYLQRADGKSSYRRLTPIEAERLQTIPDNYTAMLSDSQRYKCVGNGWTIDVITHILKYLKQ